MREFFGVGFVADALEELDSFLTFEIFQPPIFLDKFLFCFSQFNVLQVDECIVCLDDDIIFPSLILLRQL